MTPKELAAKLGVTDRRLRIWLRETFTRPEHLHGANWILTSEHETAAHAHFASGVRAKAVRPASDGEPSAPSGRPRASRGRARNESDESYVIDLCDDLLGERARRQHRFTWLVGDPSTTGRQNTLPVDAYYERHGLVIEYRERQHDEPVPFFDRRATLSGVGRGEQRRLYDQRREEEIPKHGLRLIVIRPHQLRADRRGRLLRDEIADRDVLASLLQ